MCSQGGRVQFGSPVLYGGSVNSAIEVYTNVSNEEKIGDNL